MMKIKLDKSADVETLAENVENDDIMSDHGSS